MAVTLKTSVDTAAIQARLGAVRRELPSELGEAKRKAAKAIVPVAKRHVPRTHYPERRGYLAASIAADPRGVASSVPQGPVHEFGGTIAPRGVPIRIRRSAMATKAGAEMQPQVERILDREVTALLERHF